MRTQPIRTTEVCEITDVECNRIPHQRNHANLTSVTLQKTLGGSLLNRLVTHPAMRRPEPRTNSRPEELRLHVVDLDDSERIARLDGSRHTC